MLCCYALSYINTGYSMMTLWILVVLGAHITLSYSQRRKRRGQAVTGPVVMKMMAVTVLQLTLCIHQLTLHCWPSGSEEPWERLSVTSGLN